MKHFDEMMAFLYLDRQLESVQAAEVRAHLGECAECRTLLTVLENESKWLSVSLTEKDPVPARFGAPPARTSLPWGWITALGMAAGGIITVWNGVVEPFERQLDQTGFSGGNLMTMLFFSGAFWRGWSSVLSFLEYFSVAAFAILSLALLQRYWRRGATVSVVLAGLLMTLVLATSPARGAEVFKGSPSKPNYTLPAGEILNNDIYIFADSARIDGTVNGDVIAICREVSISGHVTGDVISAAAQLRIQGRVDGNVRSVASILQLEGTIGKNVLSEGSVFDVGPAAQIGGGLTGLGGNVEMDGHIARDVMMLDQVLTIDGSVGGNLTSIGQELHLTSTAVVHGQTKYKGAHPATVDPGAKLGSPVEFTLRTHAPDYRSLSFYWHRAEFWGAAFVLGLALILVLPGFVTEGARASQKFLPSLGIGLVILIATPIVVILVCLTVVGIGVAIPALMLYVIALYAGQIFVGTWLGNVLLGRSEGTGGMLARLALGLLIVQLAQMLPLHVGDIVCFVVILWGLGAIAIGSYHCLRPAVKAAA